MVALFAGDGLYPVLVLNDADTWLSIPGLDRSNVANEFFMRTVRMLAKDIDAGLVLAVHEQYQTLDAFQSARAWFTRMIPLPPSGCWGRVAFCGIRLSFLT